MPIDRPFQKSRVLLAGGTVGVLWIAMAVTCLVSSARGYANDRLGWGLAWLFVGVLLLAAGMAALVGTWWHMNRVRRVNH